MKSQQALIITKNSKIQETCDKLHSELENALKARLKEEREKPPVPLEESNSKKKEWTKEEWEEWEKEKKKWGDKKGGGEGKEGEKQGEKAEKDIGGKDKANVGDGGEDKEGEKGENAEGKDEGTVVVWLILKTVHSVLLFSYNTPTGITV